MDMVTWEVLAEARMLGLQRLGGLIDSRNALGWRDVGSH
jgi:hypothetical protein